MHVSSDNQIQLDSHLRCPIYLSCSNMKDVLNIFAIHSTNRGGEQRSSCRISVHSSYPRTQHSLKAPLKCSELCFVRIYSSHVQAIFWPLLQTDRFHCLIEVYGSDGRESAFNAGNPGSMPGVGRSPGGGNSNPLQYSCLENSMDRGAWWAAVHGVAKESHMTERLYRNNNYLINLFIDSLP